MLLQQNRIRPGMGPNLDCPHCGEQVLDLEERAKLVFPHRRVCPFCHHTYRIPLWCNMLQLGLAGVWVVGWFVLLLSLFPVADDGSPIPDIFGEGGRLGFILIYLLCYLSVGWIAKKLGQLLSYVTPLQPAREGGKLLRRIFTWQFSHDPYLECPHCGEMALSLSARIDRGGGRGWNKFTCPHCKKAYSLPYITVQRLSWLGCGLPLLWVYLRILTPKAEALLVSFHAPYGLATALGIFLILGVCLLISHLVGAWLAYTKPLEPY